jgi:hypothetical protein
MTAGANSLTKGDCGHKGCREPGREGLVNIWQAAVRAGPWDPGTYCVWDSRRVAHFALPSSSIKGRQDRLWLPRVSMWGLPALPVTWVHTQCTRVCQMHLRKQICCSSEWPGEPDQVCGRGTTDPPACVGTGARKGWQGIHRDLVLQSSLNSLYPPDTCTTKPHTNSCAHTDSLHKHVQKHIT